MQRSSGEERHVGQTGDQTQGRLLWEPPPDARRATRMGRFLDRVQAERGVDTST